MNARGATVGVFALALSLTAGVVGSVIAGRAAAPPPSSLAMGAAPPSTQTAPGDWCATGYQPIPGGCLAVPASGPRASLLIYLHGRYARDESAEESDRQRRVAARFTPNGYAVLALRGRLGGCGFADLSDWYCWPSNERTADTAAELVATWADSLGEAERRVHPVRRFVLGFSNGGYFAGLLASRGLLPADGYVIAHGGPVEPIEAARGTPPLLLISADDDIAQDDMLRFDAELTKSRWPHDSYARAGAHGLTDQDIEAALVFFERAREHLPLDPPIRGLHRPSHHPHDAGPAPLATAIASGEDSGSEESTPYDDLEATEVTPTAVPRRDPDPE